MRITILGCRSGMPANGQASSGYLVAAGAATLLLDCGPGVATALGAVAAPDQLSAVIVTHLHLDHCYDLLPVGKSLLSRGVRYPRAGEAPQDWAEIDPVPLYVPRGSRQRLEQLAALFPVATAPVLDRTFELAFDVREYTPGARFGVGGLTVSLHELRHSAPNCGIRIESAAGAFAYTGDTGRTPALAALADGADLLLAEATLPVTDDGPHGHLSAADAAHVAQAAGVKTLVLTHFPSADTEWLLARRDEAARAFTGTIHLARPGMAFEVGPRHVASDSPSSDSPSRKALPYLHLRVYLFRHRPGGGRVCAGHPGSRGGRLSRRGRDDPATGGCRARVVRDRPVPHPGRRPVLLGGTAAILVPAQALLVPQFLMTSRAGWLNSYAGLIVPQLAGVGLALFLNTEGANPGPLLAAATLSALPVLIGYLFTARRA